jgi:uncharacterized protein DUF3352
VPRSVKTRLVPILLLAALAALAVAGCGGGGGGSDEDPASVAPAKTPFYIEATIQPEAELSENVDALAQKIAGIDDVGELIVEELRKSGDPDSPVDFEKDVEPWLGEKLGLFFDSYAGGDFHGYALAVETTDSAAAQEFIDDRPAPDEGEVVGMVGDLLVFAEDEANFKAVEEAADGESLADQDTFTSTISEAADGSLADIYVDIGGLIKQSGGMIDPDAKLFLQSSGIDPEGATAVASLVPGKDQIEIDFATNVNGDRPAPGDASQLLGALPGGSFAAIATSEFGRQLGESIDSIDEQGIAGELEPGELKEAMKAAGIDLDKITASIADVGVFAQGNTEKNLTGAVVLTTTDAKEAANTVSNVGLLLRASGTAGVTAISGKATGFSVAGAIGDKPLIVAAQGNRIAISYGPAASAQALTAEGGATLASNPEYKEAKEALGEDPISAFVDGPAALALASSILAGSDDAEGFEEAKAYLEKITFIAIGAGSSGDLATARMIVGIAD